MLVGGKDDGISMWEAAHHSPAVNRIQLYCGTGNEGRERSTLVLALLNYMYLIFIEYLGVFRRRVFI